MLSITASKFKGHDSIKLSNGVIDLEVLTSVGPRIIHCSFAGKENLFAVFNEPSESNRWKCYGGHRLWVAPESLDVTYFPDNKPVQISRTKSGICFTSAIERLSGIQRSLELVMDKKLARVLVRHTIKNCSRKIMQVAPWGLTVFKPRTIAVLPLPPKGKHPDNLLPNGSLSLWPYTDLSDPRFILSNEFIALKQDKKSRTPQKIGVHTPYAWGAALVDDVVFVKQCNYDAVNRYPDHNSNFELFTNKQMIELESLGPLQKLRSGQQIQHDEQWTLYKANEWNKSKKK